MDGRVVGRRERVGGEEDGGRRSRTGSRTKARRGRWAEGCRGGGWQGPGRGREHAESVDVRPVGGPRAGGSRAVVPSPPSSFRLWTGPAALRVGAPPPKSRPPPRAPGVLDLGPLRTRLLKGPSACLQKGRASWAACVHCGPPRGCVQGHSASRGASPRGQVFSHSHLAEWDISRGQQAETATWSMAGR